MTHRAAGKLQALVRIPTVSHRDPSLVDTAAFDAFLAAMRMPKQTDEEKAARKRAMLETTIGTIEVPMTTLEACPEIVELCLEVARVGLPQSLSDAGTGAEMARAAAAGAYQNVCINMPGLDDPAAKAKLLARADAAWEKTKELHARADREILGRLRANAG